jgi:hemoglobin
MIKHDIEVEEDITSLVHQFYTKVRNDDLLAPVFNSIIQDNWDIHLQTMCNFWSSILLYSKKYLNDPMAKHLPMPLEKKHFDKWLILFEETVDELFYGDIATTAKTRANNIARIMKSIKQIPL